MKSILIKIRSTINHFYSFRSNIKKIITLDFSIIDKDKRYDESKEIKKIIEDLNCDSYMISPNKENFLENLMLQNHGRSNPVSTISYYIHNFLSKEMKKNGFNLD